MLHSILSHWKGIYFDSIEDDSITHLYTWVIIDYATSQKREKGERRMKKILVLLFVTLLMSPLFSTISTVKAEDLAMSPSIAPPDFKPQESGCLYAGSDVLVIEDMYTWGMEQLYNAPDGAACSDLGISYDVITSTTLKLFMQTPEIGPEWLDSYKAIVLMADQPQAFYQNLYACRLELAHYVVEGGVLSAVVYRGWIGYTVTQQFLPGGVILNFEYCDDVNFDSTHFIISNPDRTVSLDGPWGYNTIIDSISYASSFYFTNLPDSLTHTVRSIAKDAHGHDVFVEYSYGDGKVIAVGIPIQWFYRYKLGLGGTGCEPPWDGANNLKLLYNELVYQSGLISFKDRLISAFDHLTLEIENRIHSMALLEAKMNAIAYLNLQFNTKKFIETVLVDLATGAIIFSPPDEIKDLLSWKVLNVLSKAMMATKLGIKSADFGLCYSVADDYIKSQGLNSQSAIEDAYYKYIMGIAPGQIAGEEKKIPFVQDTTTFNGLDDLLDSIDVVGLYISETLRAKIIPETESNVELIHYIDNLRNNLGRTSSTPSIVHHISVNAAINYREQFNDNEVGNLLNFKKQQDELVNRLGGARLLGDIAKVVKIGAAVVKVVNLLSLGAASGVELAVTIASTAMSGISTATSIVELLTKTHIFKNKLQSALQFGSEVVHLKQIFDDTGSYVLWRITESKIPVSGSIIDFSVPEVITDGLSGSQQGTLTIKNTGSNGFWAMAHIEILGPVSAGGGKMAVYFTATPSDGIRVEPGVEQTISFDYDVLDLSHIQGCNQYEARAFLSMGSKMIGPVIRFFKAGCECQSSSTSPMSGEILGSQTQSTYVTLGSESVEAEFDLSYPGSDLDLHIYDQMGNHVGMNYGTMQLDIDIPGASYSGTLPNPEWIKLPVTGGSVFRVAVVGVAVFGLEPYTVTLTEYPNYRSPSLVLNSTHGEVAYGEEVKFAISLQNRGNVPDTYHLALTGLDETWFSLSESVFSLDPGSMTTATLAIHPQATGTFSFSVIAECIDDPVISDRVEASLDVTILDTTPPTTLLTLGEPKYQGSNDVYVTSETPLTVTAEDNVGGTGVASTHYRIYNTTGYDTGLITSIPPIEFHLTGIDDGEYSIDFYSVDNIGNIEPTTTQNVILDNTPPTTIPTIGDPKYVSGRAYVTPDTPFALDATDTGSGVKLITYRINSTSYDSGWLTYAKPFNLTSLGDGNYTIAYNSTDNVGNVETTHKIDVTLFSWSYVFKDSDGRGTMLKINLAYKFFQFIAPDKDFGVKYDSKMVQLCKQVIIICYEDKEMRLGATAVDDRTCLAIAWDKQTCKNYWLIEHPPTYTLTVCCNDANGKAISGASVYLNGCCKGQTDSNGKLAITNVLAGKYTVTAKKCGYKDTSSTTTVNGDASLTLTMTAQTYTLTVCCKDSKGKAVSSANVYLNGNPKGATDLNGKLTITNLSAGTYTVTVKKSGYKDTSVNVTVTGDKTITITIAMK